MHAFHAHVLRVSMHGAKKRKTGVPYTPSNPWPPWQLARLGLKRRNTAAQRPPCISFTDFSFTATGPYSQVGSVHRPCRSPETDRPGNA